MKNEYGLDADYFKDKLFLIIRDIYYFTPEELKRELEKLIGVLECEINTESVDIIPDEIFWYNGLTEDDLDLK